MGGRQGFGRVRYTRDAPAFHESWEVRANSLYALAVRHGIFNMDEYRHAIERMEPRHYLAASYYERSFTGLATLCVEKGVLSVEELERRAQGWVPLAAPSAPGRTNVPDRERFMKWRYGPSSTASPEAATVTTGRHTRAPLSSYTAKASRVTSATSPSSRYATRWVTGESALASDARK